MKPDTVHRSPSLAVALGGCLSITACSEEPVDSRVHDDDDTTSTSDPSPTTGFASTSTEGDSTSAAETTGTAESATGDTDGTTTHEGETTQGDDSTGGDSTGEDPQEPLPDGACQTQIPSARGGAQMVPLCEVPDGVVRHVRIAGLDAGAFHTSVQLFLGFDEAPAGPQAPLDDTQFKLMVYAGTPTTLYPTLGANVSETTGEHDFTAGPTTLCFDILDGSEVAPPSFILWVHGVDGADCTDFDTLTRSSAYAWEADWNGSVGAIAKGEGSWFYQAHGIDATPVVTLFDRGVAHCETVWAENTDWQPLCEPVGGARHFRIEGTEAVANSSYVYLVVGEEEEPEGNPASDEGDGKLILTGGRNHMGLSWTWLRFSGASTTQFQLENDNGPLWVAAPTTACMDVAPDENGDARAVFWATGAAGADCTDADTLSLDNALHEETWTTALAPDQWNFVKSNNANVSLRRVVVFNDTRE